MKLKNVAIIFKLSVYVLTVRYLPAPPAKGPITCSDQPIIDRRLRGRLVVSPCVALGPRGSALLPLGPLSPPAPLVARRRPLLLGPAGA